MTRVMFQRITGNGGLQELSMTDLTDVGWLIDQNLREIHRRIETLKREAQKQVVATPTTGNNSSGDNMEAMVYQWPSGFEVNVENMQRQQWFMEDLMNPQEHMGFGGDEMNILQFEDHGHNAAIWSNPFFP